jgi:hypothetical protein
MKPSAPSKPFWILGIVLGLLGILGHFASIDVLSPNAFYLVLGGFILLALGTTLKGV